MTTPTVPRTRQGPLASHAGAGFSLLELLVVLMLLGIIMSVVMLSFSTDRNKELDKQLYRLQQVMRLAHEEAIIQRYELAIKFRPHGYEFQILNQPLPAVSGNTGSTGTGNAASTRSNPSPAGKQPAKPRWLPINDPAFLRPQELDEDIRLRLYTDGVEVNLQEENSGRLLLSSSGEMTPFELVLQYEDRDYQARLTGNLFGELRIEGLDTEEDSDES